MACDEILLDPRISYGAVGGPTFKTDVVIMDSGVESRNEAWERSGGAWDVAHSLRTQTELDYLIAFFRARRGRSRSFRFLDWSDYSLIDAPQTAWSGVSGQEIQITKTYTDAGSNTATRTITKPVDTTNTSHTLSLTMPVYAPLVVKDDGTALTPTTDYTVDYTTGIITAARAGITGACTVTGSFHVHVRFDDDQMQVSIEAYDANTWGQILVVELKS